MQEATKRSRVAHKELPGGSIPAVLDLRARARSMPRTGCISNGGGADLCPGKSMSRFNPSSGPAPDEKAPWLCRGAFHVICRGSATTRSRVERDRSTSWESLPRPFSSRRGDERPCGPPCGGRPCGRPSGGRPSDERPCEPPSCGRPSGRPCEPSCRRGGPPCEPCEPYGESDGVSSGPPCEPCGAPYERLSSVLAFVKTTFHSVAPHGAGEIRRSRHPRRMRALDSSRHEIEFPGRDPRVAPE
jgi:hypothetical protein